MKSLEQLRRLAENPFYEMSAEEKLELELLESESKKASSVREDSKKKLSQTTLGNAAVKETGKINKHPSDPVME